VTSERIREHVALESPGAKDFKNVSAPREVDRVIPPGVYPKLRG
jgi:hypothetical protein